MAMFARIVPIVACAALVACGQQHPPETATDPAPATTDATAPPPSTRPPATRAAEQVGMGAATSDSSDAIPDAANPTGRGVLGDTGRGQGPAPGQDANPGTVTADRVTEEEALARCRDAALRAECEANVRRGFDRIPQPTQADSDAAPDLRPTDENPPASDGE